MSAKKAVVITMASLMIAGSSIAGQKNGGREGCSEREGKNRQEQMQKKGRHQGYRGGGIDRLINNPKVRKELGITDEQIERLKDAKVELENQRKDLIAEIKKARKKQMDLMRADELDKTAIMAAINQSGKLRTKMERLRVKELFEVQDILTKEQLGKVKERMQKQMRKHRKEFEGKGNKNNRKGKGKRDNNAI